MSSTHPRRSLSSSVAMALSLVLLAITQVSARPAIAKEFDITGTLDCGVRSGSRCTFSDWTAGPVIAVLTEDISGTRERVLIDASWIKNDLDDFDQDDFVWFTVTNAVGPTLQATGVVEHHCNDGRVSLGIINNGKSHGQGCHR